jgi:hypothetical protein
MFLNPNPPENSKDQKTIAAPSLNLGEDAFVGSITSFRPLELEEFAEALGLLTGDRDFGLLFVVHFEHEAGLEPGHHFLDVVDVDEEGTVRAPERFLVEGAEEFLEGAIVGSAFDVFGDDRNEAAFDGSEDEIARIDEKHALLGADKDFGGLRRRRLGGGELRDKLLEALGGAGVGLNFLFCFLDGFGDAGLVKRLEDVVNGVDVEGLDGVVVESGGKDDVGHFELALNEFFEHAEAIKAGHLDVEKEQVGRMLFDEIDGFDAVFALSEEVDV